MTDIIATEITFDTGYGEMCDVPARMNLDDETGAELISFTIGGKKFDRYDLIEMTSRAEVDRIEEDARSAAVEAGQLTREVHFEEAEKDFRRHQIGWGGV